MALLSTQAAGRVCLLRQSSPQPKIAKPGVLDQRLETIDNEHIQQFFNRNGFSPLTREACHRFARSRYPSAEHPEITPLNSQGYCSYTLSISSRCLLQFRPSRYMLNMEICRQATQIHGHLAPRTEYLGSVPGIARDDGVQDEPVVHVYQQERVPGVTLREFRRNRDRGDMFFQQCQKRLIEDLASVFAMSFSQHRPPNILNKPGQPKKGRVGSSLNSRLDLLIKLPGEALQSTASQTYLELARIESLPWCLTHGDLIPDNIMVDPVSGRLTGLIDWAEAEWLPFGSGMYGLEEVLCYEDDIAGAMYYDNHKELRALFWDSLLNNTAWMMPGPGTLVREISLARTLGVLLWYGIAFDDGRMDRVVQPGRDDLEVQKIRLFLDSNLVDTS